MKIRANKVASSVCTHCVERGARIRNLESELRILSEKYEQLQSENEVLRNESRRDPLTNIFNRREFDFVIKREVTSAGRYGYPLCYVMVDIDHFKRVNDVYGHGTGDMILKFVATLLAQGCRTNDFVARLGGEEFGIILPHTDKYGALVLMDRLRILIQRESFHASAGKSFTCTASFGIGQLQEGQDIPMLLNTTDKALYEAKRRGRNQITMA